MKTAGMVFLFVFILLYLVPLGVRPLAIPDETRYAEIPREMIATGDWIVPRLDGIRYFEKPVLGPWLNAIAITLFGENAFAIRLPSALAAGFSSLLIWTLVRRFGGGSQPALLTAAAYLTCLEVFFLGTFSVLDSVFSLFVTATLVCFYVGWNEHESLRKRNACLVLAGLACGLAFLAKGFIAVVLPVAVIVPFLLWQRRWKDLPGIGLLPLIAAVLTALPWCLAIHAKEPDFWRYFFWHEHVQRFLNPQSGQHPGAVWYFIPVILVGSLPWSVWLPHAVAGLKNRRLQDPFLRFLICWLAFPFLFFSVCGGKLVTYLLPCFPPWIMLIVLGFLRWLEIPGNDKKLATSLSRSAILLTLVAVGWMALPLVPVEALRLYPTGQIAKGMLFGISILAYAAVLAMARRQTDARRRLVLCCLAPVPVFFCIAFAVPEKLKAGAMPGNFLVRNAATIHPDTVLVSDDSLAPALGWFYRRDDVYLLGKAGEFEYGLSYDDAKRRWIPGDAFAEFLARHSRPNPVVLILRNNRYDAYRPKLPKPAREIRENGFVLAEFEQ
jgi:4-amino-4-deoxy-L-arabinose transferase